MKDVAVIASEMIVFLSRDQQLFSCMRIMPSDTVNSPSMVYNPAKTDSEK